MNRTDLSEVIAEEFGANATYVEGLLERFRNNPDLVDDSWRSYFSELIGDGNGAKAVAPATDGDRPQQNKRPRRPRLLQPLHPLRPLRLQQKPKRASKLLLFADLH